MVPAYAPFETGYLPLLIGQLPQGHTELLYPWAANYISRWGDDAFAWGLYFAVNCQDDAQWIDAEKVASQIAAYPDLDGYFRFRDELAVCEAWGLEGAPALASQSVVSHIPTLVLAGTYDPITPPDWGRMATANLSNATFVEFSGAGHSVLIDNPCAQEIVAEFLDDPEKALNLRCMETTSEPAFVLPNEIIDAPAMYEIHYGELGYSMLEENLFLGSWLSLLGSGVTVLMAGLIRITRRRREVPSEAMARFAPRLLILLSLIALIWGYALRFTLQSVAATTPIVLRFGLPARYGWLFGMVYLIGMMTVLMIATTVLAWKRKTWTLVRMIAFSVSCLAAITFTGVLVKWGLFTALFQ